MTTDTLNMQAPQPFGHSNFFYYNPDSRGEHRQAGHFSPNPKKAMSTAQASASPSQLFNTMKYNPQPAALPSNSQLAWRPFMGRMSSPAMAMVSPRPLNQRPTILINDESTVQHPFGTVDAVQDIYQFPSTPPLSVADSVISSPPSTCGAFSASGSDSIFLSQEQMEDFKHVPANNELKSTTLSVSDWPWTASAPPTPSMFSDASLLSL